jgi:hypothetical protein
VKQRRVRPTLPAQGIERRQGLLRAAGHDERGRDALQAVGDVREDAQRRAVGPVGVVDEDRQRALRGEVGGQPIQRVPGGERVVRGCRGRPVELDREQRGSEPRRAGKERGRVDDRAAQDLVEQLADDPEAERPLELGAACSQHEQVLVLRDGQRGVQQRRLADARRAVDDDQAAGSLRGSRERPPDRLELVLTLEEPAGCHRCLRGHGQPAKRSGRREITLPLPRGPVWATMAIATYQRYRRRRPVPQLATAAPRLAARCHRAPEPSSSFL